MKLSQIPQNKHFSYVCHRRFCLGVVIHYTYIYLYVVYSIKLDMKRVINLHKIYGMCKRTLRTEATWKGSINL